MKPYKGLNIPIIKGGYIKSLGSSKPVDLDITWKGGLKLGFRKTSPAAAYEILGMWESLEKKETKNLIDKIYQDMPVARFFWRRKKRLFPDISTEDRERGYSFGSKKTDHWRPIGGLFMSEEVEVTIQTKGKVAFRVKGVKGKECLNLTHELEKVLGQLKEGKLSSEYFQTPIGGKIKTNISRDVED